MPFDLKNGPGGNKLTVLLCICVLGTKVVFHLHCFSHRITKSSNLQTPSNGRSELDTLPPVTSSCASNCLSNILHSISAVIGLLEKLCKDYAVPTAIVNCKRYTIQTQIFYLAWCLHDNTTLFTFHPGPEWLSCLWRRSCV